MARTDFHWVPEDEPHARRKQEILKKYGDQIRPLMRPEPLTIPIVFGLVAIQVAVAFATKEWGWAAWLATAYVVGGTINHALFLAIHEIVHYLACENMWGNRVLACVANIPIGFPYTSTFHQYHMEHHRMQGHDGVDVDIPTVLEANIINNYGMAGKFFFCFFQILFYALRPMFITSPRASPWTAVNWALQLSFLVWMYETTGCLTPQFYFLISTFFAGCLHPVSGHFLSEHFETTYGYETYSYYGPLNYLAFNVGYHNEHHDFPNIPWSRLPQVKKIAPEYYENLPQCQSWPGLIFEFITNPKLGAYSRVKRFPRDGRKVE